MIVLDFTNAFEITDRKKIQLILIDKAIANIGPTFPAWRIERNTLRNRIRHVNLQSRICIFAIYQEKQFKVRISFLFIVLRSYFCHKLIKYFDL